MLQEVKDRQAAAEHWLSRFRSALAAGDRAALAGLFLAESWWRDVLALGWELRTLEGPEAIAAALAAAADRDLAITLERLPAEAMRAGSDTLEAFFSFEGARGRGRGILRLRPDPATGGALGAWTLLTALEELAGHPEATGLNRPTGQANSRDFRGPNWLDQRRAAAAYADRDPAVIVVGGGQAGLSIAARLTALGVDALIVDRHARVGDNWRLRYHALTLHNQVQVNHLPYMPFPPGWPTYIPKDKLANWFEAYVEAQELNFWCSTEMLGGDWDEAAGRWNARLRLADGSERALHPRHIVMATGVSGLPVMPDLPGLDDFAGEVVHSHGYRDGEDWSGKRAIVVGTGNSGHDISQDLWSSGAEVTLVQRSPTLVVNIEPSAQLPYAFYNDGLSTDDCDLIAVSMPVPLTRRAHQGFTRRSEELDRATLEGLKRRGFRLSSGPDGTGWQFLYLSRGGGYYFNVGCSELIAEGKVRLVQFAEIERFDATGARLRDGSAVPADLVVLATGYRGQEYLVARMFGQDVAARVGPIWGYGEGLELRNMYCRTGQPGLWFIAGSLAQCRINSRFLALQIKAVEEGLAGA